MIIKIMAAAGECKCYDNGSCESYDLQLTVKFVANLTVSGKELIKLCSALSSVSSGSLKTLCNNNADDKQVPTTQLIASKQPAHDT